MTLLKRFKLAEGYVRQSWSYWSVKLLAAATLLATWAAMNPQQAAQVIALVPEQYRPLATLGLGFLAWWLRGARQHPAP